jgi:uncharacterized protein YqeY
MNNSISLKAKIQNDMKEAMRAHDKSRLAVIRFLLAAIKQREIDERITLNDTQIITVIEKQIKQRRDSIAQYEAANRTELAEKEKFELGVLQTYMPEPLSEDDLDKLIKTTITEMQATSMRDMGKVMGSLKTKIEGRADMGLVGAKIKQLLQ